MSLRDYFAAKAMQGLLAIFQNLACEVEKLMGIYPNVPKIEGSKT
jgi:hypothetical protein